MGDVIKIGAISIGQAPRTDITMDMHPFFGDRVELLEAGALDSYTVEEARALRPISGDYLLTSRLRDGSEAHFSKRQIFDTLQEKIFELEARGVQFIMVFCTGELDGLQSSVPLLETNQLVRAMVPLLTRKSHVLTLVPSEAQIMQSEDRWKSYMPGRHVTALAVSPYTETTIPRRVIDRINACDDADLIVMDCMGFSVGMRNELQKATNKNIFLPRTMLFRTAGELLGL